MNDHVRYGETWALPKSTFDRICSGDSGICRFLIQRGGFLCTKPLKDLRAYMVDVEHVTPSEADRVIRGLDKLPVNCGGPPDFIRTEEIRPRGPHHPFKPRAEAPGYCRICRGIAADKLHEPDGVIRRFDKHVFHPGLASDGFCHVCGKTENDPIHNEGEEVA